MTDDELVHGAVRLAQQLIRQLHAVNLDNSTFSQVGLVDGEEIVVEHLAVGELGCALHHALYMVHEADIAFPKETVRALHELAARIGERNHYSAENVRRLSPEHRRHVFNRVEE